MECSQRMGYVCLSLVVAHVVVLGLRAWLSPQTWPWMLPPISLVAAGRGSSPTSCPSCPVKTESASRVCLRLGGLGSVLPRLC